MREKSITDVREGAFSDLIPVDLRREHFHVEPVFVVTFEFVAQFDLLPEHALRTVVNGQELGVNGVGAIATVVEAIGARS